MVSIFDRSVIGINTLYSMSYDYFTVACIWIVLNEFIIYGSHHQE
jgi:hypothetical protein